MSYFLSCTESLKEILCSLFVFILSQGVLEPNTITPVRLIFTINELEEQDTTVTFKMIGSMDSFLVGLLPICLLNKLTTCFSVILCNIKLFVFCYFLAYFEMYVFVLTCLAVIKILIFARRRMSVPDHETCLFLVTSVLHPLPDDRRN